MTVLTGDGPIVDVAWLRGHLGGPKVRVIDARPFGNYAAGHLPGALSLDLNAIRMSDSSPAGVAAFFDHAGLALRRVGIRSDERVVFYEDFSGASAARGVWLLDAVGHRNGAILDGGLQAWVESGGDLTRAIPAVVPSDLPITPDPSVFTTADEILALLATDPHLTVLDTRNDREYQAGTIPGAVHVEWIDHLRPDGTFRQIEENRDLYDAVGIGPDRQGPVITFCGSGYRSASSYLVIKTLGTPVVKNYVCSWGEWGRRPDLPIASPDRV